MWITRYEYNDLKQEAEIRKEIADQWKKNYENLREFKDDSKTIEALSKINGQQAAIITAKDALIETLLFSLNAKEKINEVS